MPIPVGPRTRGSPIPCGPRIHGTAWAWFAADDTQGYGSGSSSTASYSHHWANGTPTDGTPGSSSTASYSHHWDNYTPTDGTPIDVPIARPGLAYSRGNRTNSLPRAYKSFSRGRLQELLKEVVCSIRDDSVNEWDMHQWLHDHCSDDQYGGHRLLHVSAHAKSSTPGKKALSKKLDPNHIRATANACVLLFNMLMRTNYRFAEGGVDVNDDQLWSATYAPWFKNLNHAFTKEQTKEEDCCFANTIGYVSLFPPVLFLYAFLFFVLCLRQKMRLFLHNLNFSVIM